MELTRTGAEGLSTDRPETPKRWKPTTWTLESGGECLLVKDVRYTAPVFRYTLGRWNLRREVKAYRRLSGLECVARYLGRFDADAIVLERMDAVPLSRERAAELDVSFFDELLECVEAMHDRGIVHLDLRHRSNLLVGADDRPRLIDFENAFYLGRNFLSRRLLIPLFAWIDRSAVLKFRVRYFPDEVSERETRKNRFYSRIRRLWPFGRLWPLGPFAE